MKNGTPEQSAVSGVARAMNYDDAPSAESRVSLRRMKVGLRDDTFDALGWKWRPGSSREVRQSSDRSLDRRRVETMSPIESHHPERRDEVGGR